MADKDPTPGTSHTETLHKLKLKEYFASIQENEAKSEDPKYSFSNVIIGAAAREFRDKLAKERASIEKMIVEFEKNKEERTDKSGEELYKQIKDLKAKTDLTDLSSSKWTAEDFFKKADVDPQLRLEKDPIDEGDWTSIKNGYKQLAKLLGIPEEPEEFVKRLPRYPEETVADFVKGVIGPLLLRKERHIMVQETIKVPGLPSCRCDISIYHPSIIPIGVIETKAGGKLNQNSLVQCMLQLLAYQARQNVYDMFGIVTDGVQFVFITLTTQGKFLIDGDNNTEQMRVHKWKNLEELRVICEIINGLLGLAKEQTAVQSPEKSDFSPGKKSGKKTQRKASGNEAQVTAPKRQKRSLNQQL